MTSMSVRELAVTYGVCVLAWQLWYALIGAGAWCGWYWMPRLTRPHITRSPLWHGTELRYDPTDPEQVDELLRILRDGRGRQ